MLRVDPGQGSPISHPISHHEEHHEEQTTFSSVTVRHVGPDGEVTETRQMSSQTADGGPLHTATHTARLQTGMPVSPGGTASLGGTTDVSASHFPMQAAWNARREENLRAQAQLIGSRASASAPRSPLASTLATPPRSPLPSPPPSPRRQHWWKRNKSPPAVAVMPSMPPMPTMPHGAHQPVGSHAPQMGQPQLSPQEPPSSFAVSEEPPPSFASLQEPPPSFAPPQQGQALPPPVLPSPGQQQQQIAPSPTGMMAGGMPVSQPLFPAGFTVVAPTSPHAPLSSAGGLMADSVSSDGGGGGGLRQPRPPRPPRAPGAAVGTQHVDANLDDHAVEELDAAKPGGALGGASTGPLLASMEPVGGTPRIASHPGMMRPAIEPVRTDALEASQAPRSSQPVPAPGLEMRSTTPADTEILGGDSSSNDETSAQSYGMRSSLDSTSGAVKGHDSSTGAEGRASLEGAMSAPNFDAPSQPADVAANLRENADLEVAASAPPVTSPTHVTAIAGGAIGSMEAAEKPAQPPLTDELTHGFSGVSASSSFAAPPLNPVLADPEEVQPLIGAVSSSAPAGVLEHGMAKPNGDGGVKTLDPSAAAAAEGSVVPAAGDDTFHELDPLPSGVADAALDRALEVEAGAADPFTEVRQVAATGTGGQHSADDAAPQLGGQTAEGSSPQGFDFEVGVLRPHHVPIASKQEPSSTAEAETQPWEESAARASSPGPDQAEVNEKNQAEIDDEEESSAVAGEVSAPAAEGAPQDMSEETLGTTMEDAGAAAARSEGPSYTEAAKGKTAEGYHAVADAAATTAEAVQQTAGETWQAVKDTLSHATEATTEFVSTKAQQAKETAGSAAQATAEGVANAADTAKHAAANVAGSVSEAANTARGSTADAADIEPKRAAEQQQILDSEKDPARDGPAEGTDVAPEQAAEPRQTLDPEQQSDDSPADGTDVELAHAEESREAADAAQQRAASLEAEVERMDDIERAADQVAVASETPAEPMGGAAMTDADSAAWIAHKTAGDTASGVDDASYMAAGEVEAQQAGVPPQDSMNTAAMRTERSGDLEPAELAPLTGGVQDASLLDVGSGAAAERAAAEGAPSHAGEEAYTGEEAETAVTEGETGTEQLPLLGGEPKPLREVYGAMRSEHPPTPATQRSAVVSVTEVPQDETTATPEADSMTEITEPLGEPSSSAADGSVLDKHKEDATSGGRDKTMADNDMADDGQPPVAEARDSGGMTELSPAQTSPYIKQAQDKATAYRRAALGAVHKLVPISQGQAEGAPGRAANKVVNYAVDIPISATATIVAYLQVLLVALLVGLYHLVAGRTTSGAAETASEGMMRTGASEGGAEGKDTIGQNGQAADVDAAEASSSLQREE